VLLARLALRRDHQRLQPAPPRRLDPACVCPVGDDDRNVRVELARSDVVGDGLKVRAAPGKQDAKVLHGDMRIINVGLETSWQALLAMIALRSWQH
jgi:hypothetical protein